MIVAADFMTDYTKLNTAQEQLLIACNQELSNVKKEHTATHKTLSRVWTELVEVEHQLRENEHCSNALQEEKEYKLKQTTLELEVANTELFENRLELRKDRFFIRRLTSSATSTTTSTTTSTPTSTTTKK